MLESDLINSTSSWPFVEIRKLLKDRKEIIKKKNKITFQTGYGPSGLPHIGCLLYTSPSPRDQRGSRMAESA